MKRLVVFSFLLLAIADVTFAATVYFNAAQVATCTTQNSTCIVQWNNANSWIGGRAPGATDDVIIDAGSTYFTFVCSISNWEANNVNVSAKSVTFRLNQSQTLSLSSLYANSTFIQFNNGTFIAKSFVTAPQFTLTTFSYANITIDQADLGSMDAISSVVTCKNFKIRMTLLLAESSLIGSDSFDVADITLLLRSTITIPNACNIKDNTETAVHESTIITTPKCHLDRYSGFLFANSTLIMTSVNGDSYFFSNIFELNNSTMKLRGVKANVNSQFILRDNSLIESDKLINIQNIGQIGGQGTIKADVAISNGGKIKNRYDTYGDTQYCLKINGGLTMDDNSELYLRNSDYIAVDSAFINDATLDVVYNNYNGNGLQTETNYSVVVFNDDSFFGQFGRVNMSSSYGYLKLSYERNTVLLHWSVNAPVAYVPHVNVPHQPQQQPYQQPINSKSPINNDNPTPIQMHDPNETDGKTIAIVVLSILLGVSTLVIGSLLYSRLAKRRNYAEINTINDTL